MRCRADVRSACLCLQSPLLRLQNPHPLGVRYNTNRNNALQLLGDICMSPLQDGFLEAAGSSEAKAGVLVRP